MNVGFLSTYPPRECGIATFTQDLLREMEQLDSVKTGVVAISDGSYDYGNEVLLELLQHNREDYKSVAQKINSAGFDVLMVEHEYGIYGGDCGEYVLDLLDKVGIPVAVTLHTVLPAPTEKQRVILNRLCRAGDRIIVMSQSSKHLLEEIYKVPPEKIQVIHHGVPSFPVLSREELKAQYGFSGRIVISTFGMLGPGKGLEYAIEAIGQAAERYPDILYLILGKTHPVIMQNQGEAYRQSLQQLVTELNLDNHVRFVNKYLAKEEIIQFLQLSDIYMTPYLGKDQAVSGTLAYAIGYGRVVVSTPYTYACEMLAEDRGILAEFRDPRSLAEAIEFLVENPEKRLEMEKNVERLGQNMTWSQIARQYRDALAYVFV